MTAAGSVAPGQVATVDAVAACPATDDGLSYGAAFRHARSAVERLSASLAAVESGCPPVRVAVERLSVVLTDACRACPQPWPLDSCCPASHEPVSVVLTDACRACPQP
ncbi:hypothetical protein GCM10023079_30880 [Streptomyces chitinivorans]